MRSLVFRIVVAAAVPGLAACASAPEKPPGVFDLSNGLERPTPWSKDTTSVTGASEVGALGVPTPNSPGGGAGASTPGHGGGIGGINLLGN